MADEREITNPSDPHPCRCAETGADGSYQHYRTVATIQSRRFPSNKPFPVCVNHIGNYAQFPDGYKITILEEMKND